MITSEILSVNTSDHLMRVNYTLESVSIEMRLDVPFVNGVLGDKLEIERFINLNTPIKPLKRLLRIEQGLQITEEDVVKMVGMTFTHDDPEMKTVDMSSSTNNVFSPFTPTAVDELMADVKLAAQIQAVLQEYESVRT